MEPKTLLDETEIGEAMSIGAVMDEEEVALFVSSIDISASCSFSHEEWERFVEGVNRANEKYVQSRDA